MAEIPISVDTFRSQNIGTLPDTENLNEIARFIWLIRVAHLLNTIEVIGTITPDLAELRHNLKTKPAYPHQVQAERNYMTEGD